uniref:Putative secreted protein n=1 Tax=Anopheles marajoara TaxID=58244 RepID=A0A2M4CF67_9DIPT
MMTFLLVVGLSFVWLSVLLPSGQDRCPGRLLSAFWRPSGRMDEWSATECFKGEQKELRAQRIGVLLNS